MTEAAVGGFFRVLQGRLAVTTRSARDTGGVWTILKMAVIRGLR